MTLDELKIVVKANNLSSVCFLEGNSYTTTPGDCGIYRDELFYYLYYVTESGQVSIIKKSKNPNAFCNFILNYLNIRISQRKPTLQYKRRDLNGKRN